MFNPKIQSICVTAVDDGRVVGYLNPNGYNNKNKVSYSDDFENIAKIVVKISERKINPVKTSIAILVPTIVIAPLVAVIIGGVASGMTF